MEPRKFTYVTNGVTHRRWLMACNPRLTALISEAIGEQWKTQPERLSDLLPMRDDAAFRERFQNIKRQNKDVFNEFLKRRQDMQVDPEFMFDVQVKRLHGTSASCSTPCISMCFTTASWMTPVSPCPRVFVFGAKASRGYYKAKMIIRYYPGALRLIDRSPRARKMLRIMFVENWNVSAAEALIPAADLSEQISTAGKEASGTGNVKLMMNGAVTTARWTAPSRKISQAVGKDNIYYCSA